MRLNILILDDERAGVQDLHNALSAKHDVVWARSINRALTEVDESTFDIIICGVHLLNESMFDFLKQVTEKAENKRIPFVCFRAVEPGEFGKSSDRMIENASKMVGADKYIAVETNRDDPEALRRDVESVLLPLLQTRS